MAFPLNEQVLFPSTLAPFKRGKTSRKMNTNRARITIITAAPPRVIPQCAALSTALLLFRNLIINYLIFSSSSFTTEAGKGT